MVSPSPSPDVVPSLNVWIFPVSGSFFSAQIGIIAFFTGVLEEVVQQLIFSSPVQPFDQRKFRCPDLVFASSGGNIAAYLGHASDWEKKRILTNTNLLQGEAFLTGWADYIPSWVFLPFARSFFRPGFGFRRTFHRLFASNAAAAFGTEIWTGAFHKVSHQHALFTNKKKGTTLIVPDETCVSPFHPSSLFHSSSFSSSPSSSNGFFLGDRMAPIYTNGNLDVLADVCMASAAIPFMVKPVTVQQEEYSDGGSLCASPFTALAEKVKSSIILPPMRTEELSASSSPSPSPSSSYPSVLRRLRLIYFSSWLFNDLRLKPDSDFQIISTLMSSIAFSDIRAFIGTITFLGGTEQPNEKYDFLTHEEGVGLIQRLESTTMHYGILFFPGSKENSVDFTSVTAEKLHLAANRAQYDIHAFVWKVPF